MYSLKVLIKFLPLLLWTYTWSVWSVEPRYIVCWLSIYLEISSFSLLQVALVDPVVRIRCTTKVDPVLGVSSPEITTISIRAYRLFPNILELKSHRWRSLQHIEYQCLYFNIASGNYIGEPWRDPRLDRSSVTSRPILWIRSSIYNGLEEPFVTFLPYRGNWSLIAIKFYSVFSSDQIYTKQF